MRRLYLIPFFLTLSFVIHAVSGEEAITLASMRTGTILEISLEDNSVLIDQKKFKLAEGFQAYTEDSATISKVLLAPGMKVDYWVNSTADAEEVTRVKINSKFDKDAYAR
jgi:hypothetical protein